MANNQYCLKNIIGLTNKDCDCFGTVIADYKVSKTGIFLDTYVSPYIELEYGCDSINTWQKLLEKLNEAKSLFISEFSSKLNTKYSKLFSNLDILLGRKNHVAVDYTITVPKFVIKTKSLKGFSLRINSLGLLVNKNGTVEVTIKKISTKNVVTIERTVIVYVTNGLANIFEIANSLEEPNPIILNCDGSTYTLEYNLTGFNTYNNTIENSCSSCNDDLVRILPFLSESLYISNNKIANGFLIGIDGFCDITHLPCNILSDSPEFLYTFGDLIAKRTKMQILTNAVSSGSSFRLIGNSNLQTDLEETTKQYWAGIDTLLKSHLPKIKNSCFCKNDDNILTVR